MGSDSETFADVVMETIALALAPVQARLAQIEDRFGSAATETALLLTREISPLRERLAVVETKLPVPGPPGPAGKDGVDGLGFDDLGVVQKDERSFTITATRGDIVKDIGTAQLPVEIYRGVWVDGRTYDSGDSVTWAGSEWHCHVTTTTKPGEGSKAWTLKVKRGRDGKDGKDGAIGPEGPRGKDWQQVYDDTRRRP